MKTIIENATKLSKYLLHDDTPVTFLKGQINVGEPTNLDFIIGDLNKDNASLVEGVSVEVDGPTVTIAYAGNFRSADVEDTWVGNKFIYDGGWLANPEWSKSGPEDMEETE